MCLTGISDMIIHVSLDFASSHVNLNAPIVIDGAVLWGLGRLVWFSRNGIIAEIRLETIGGGLVRANTYLCSGSLNRDGKCT